MTLDDVKSLIKDDFLAVDAIIRAELTSDVALINQLSSYIIDGGGKRLRPILTLLTARACGYTGTNHTKLAAVIELIHTATLLHDDVVDAS
ncbi:MAG TPA: polyprenyl synthetase family protein, partial [Gammaproteobacteria bacterium]|nr:polyprenyl synthetase family protein [Gammaproteobacteria bacterium]